MTNSQEFYKNEQEKWDSISIQKLYPAEVHKLKIEPEDNFFEMAQRSTVMNGVNSFFGNVKGKRVLEVGCCSGKIAALFAKSGAHVTAFDLSPISTKVARTCAVINNLDLVAATGERLPFANESFDIICERAVFDEPMGMNPILNFVRDYVPYPQKNPVRDDKPLSYEDIAQ